MADWGMWFVLAGMLLVGELTSVGCFLRHFATAAVAGGLGALGGLPLDDQLSLFLLAAAVQVIAVRWILPRLARRGGALDTR